MMELREKIEELITDANVGRAGQYEGPRALADRILAIPEIANGVALLQSHGDMLHGGTGYVRVTRVDPGDVRPLGHSISTRPTTER